MATYTFPVKLTYPGAGGPGYNIWHMRTTGDAPSTGDLDGLSDLVANFYSSISGLFPQGYTAQFEGVATTVGEDPVYDTSAEAWSVAGAGSSAAIMPQATAICLTLRTSSASRSGRGRKFLGPMYSGVAAADGTPGDSQLTTIRDAAATLVEESDGFGNGAIGVYSFSQSLFRDLTGYSVRDQFAVLRSRRD